MGKPELLSPAGDRERLDMALAYGADAVYLAGNAYGMRAFAGNFGREDLAEAVKAAPRGKVLSTDRSGKSKIL